jgi:SAM-dependent methyltransferase
MYSLQKIFIPPRFGFIYNEFKDLQFSMLDVGCGNNSAQLAKKWFKNVRYYGLDNGVFFNEQEDFELMEIFYDKDLTRDALDDIPSDFFDVALMNHVIEHLPNGISIIGEIAKKIKPNGIIYIEYPSVNSLSAPNMPNVGNLNFSDDLTHVRLYGLVEVCNELLSNGFVIIRAGVRRRLTRIILLPLFLILGLLRGRYSVVFWDYYGVAEYIYAKKK